jgi:hypothetical protein
LLKITKFNGTVFDGIFESSGNISLNPFVANIAYGTRNTNLKALNEVAKRPIIPNTGTISSSGSVATRGGNVSEIVDNIYMDSSILVGNIVFPNLGLDDFIIKINAEQYSPDKLDEDVQYSMLNGNTDILQASAKLNLVRGIINMSDVNLRTKYSVANANVRINTKDFNIQATSNINFLLRNPQKTGSLRDSVFSTIKFFGKYPLISKDFDIAPIKKILGEY